ncbi:MAG: VanZ family protein [Bacteroidia bacterium]
MKLRRAQIPAILWTLFIASSCLLPASAFKSFSFDSLIQVDKLVHLVLYITFVVLWYLAWPSWKTNYSFILLVIGILYGVLIEILQSEMSLGRSYDVADILANTAGAILGVILIPFISRKLPLIKKYLPFLDKLY